MIAAFSLYEGEIVDFEYAPNAKPVDVNDARLLAPEFPGHSEVGAPLLVVMNVMEERKDGRVGCVFLTHHVVDHHVAREAGESGADKSEGMHRVKVGLFGGLDMGWGVLEPTADASAAFGIPTRESDASVRVRSCFLLRWPRRQRDGRVGPARRLWCGDPGILLLAPSALGGHKAGKEFLGAPGGLDRVDGLVLNHLSDLGLYHKLLFD